jgi:signal transduction histidine kinase
VADRNGVFLYEINMGDWLYCCYYGGIFVVVIELLSLILLLLKGTNRVRYRLRPLNEIAKKAAELGNMTLDESKYRNLEAEISKLEVDAMENGIHMHDKELSGIETALNGLLERIRASYKQQSQFVSDASHELRTPIAVIQGYVNMLDRWGKEDEAVLDESITAIKNEANHMQKLVEQLLFLARGDSNRQTLDMKEHNLNDIIKEVYEESVMIDDKHTYRFEQKGTAQLVCDLDMLKQSARILIDNAAKYTKEGGEIIISVGLWKDGSPFYQIQDNGIGMALDDVTHAFDRFYRADSVRNSKTGGTGLGLSIAKWIVDRHNGYYDIVSREGLGTRVSVVFGG